MKRLSIRVGPALARRIEGLAEESGQPVSCIAREAIEDGLSNEAGQARQVIRILQEVRSLQIVGLASLFSMPGMTGKEFKDVAAKAKEIAGHYQAVVAAGEVEDE